MEMFNFYVNEWYRNRLNLHHLFYCQIHVTKRCQNECQHCYFKELDLCNMDFPVEGLLHTLDVIKAQSVSLGLLPRVDFTGGDPLLYPYLEQILDYCMALNIPYGFKCNPENLLYPSDCLKNYLQQSSGVTLSLDGLKETHDSFRCPGSFERTIEAIKVLKELGVQLRLNTTVSRKNINNLIPLLDFLIQERIVVDDYTWSRYWSIDNSDDIINSCELKIVFSEMTQYMRKLFSLPSFYIRMSDGRLVPQIMFGFKEHQWYPFLVQEGIVRSNIQELIARSTNCINCTATKHFYIIDPDLSVYKCRKLPETKIDIAEFGKQSVCNYGEQFDLECKKCLYYNGCGGCSAIAKCYTGNIVQTEPLCPYMTHKEETNKMQR